MPCLHSDAVQRERQCELVIEVVFGFEPTCNIEGVLLLNRIALECCMKFKLSTKNNN